MAAVRAKTTHRFPGRGHFLIELLEKREVGSADLDGVYEKRPRSLELTPECAPVSSTERSDIGENLPGERQTGGRDLCTKTTTEVLITGTEPQDKCDLHSVREQVNTKDPEESDARQTRRRGRDAVLVGTEWLALDVTYFPLSFGSLVSAG